MKAFDFPGTLNNTFDEENMLKSTVLTCVEGDTAKATVTPRYCAGPLWSWPLMAYSNETNIVAAKCQAGKKIKYRANQPL